MTLEEMNQIEKLIAEYSAQLFWRLSDLPTIAKDSYYQELKSGDFRDKKETK